MENKQFEEWWDSQDKYSNEYTHSTISWHQFLELPFEYRWGVYLEFFDSVGICVEVVYATHPEMLLWVFRIDKEILIDYPCCNSRQEAQQEAIKKAFELL
jgi:hypothetical protein